MKVTPAVVGLLSIAAYTCRIVCSIHTWSDNKPVHMLLHTNIISPIPQLQCQERQSKRWKTELEEQMGRGGKRGRDLSKGWR